jgi:hypothetical protein
MLFTRGVYTPAPTSCIGSNVQLAGNRMFLNGLGSVEQLTTVLKAATLSATVPLSRPVDITRTLVFASSQAGGAGQGAGETSLVVADVLGDFIAAHVLDGGAAFDSQQLILARDSALGDVSWTSYVVELGP